MVRDRDSDAYGTVLLDKEVGTARIAAERNEPVVWKNDRFGSWLVCQRPVSGVYELRWWEVITNRGIDKDASAKVGLISVEIDENNNHQEC
jgi:hypothetical protein